MRTSFTGRPRENLMGFSSIADKLELIMTNPGMNLISGYQSVHSGTSIRYTITWLFK